MTRKSLLACLALPLAWGQIMAAEDTKFADETDKINYTIGFRLGNDFKRQGVDVREQMIINGIKDAAGGAKPQLTPDEMRTALMNLQQRIKAEQLAKRQEHLQANLAAAEAFLAENKTKEGVVTLPSGLQYKVLAEGTGTAPQPADKVTVNYRGTLIDGTEFDSSYSRNQPATFGVDRVIAGWTEALQLMHPGAKWQLFIPPQLAYGEQGQGSKIPPNSALIFEVELIKVN
ncbi:MAG: FKBP-type peptidyl-prolyl cis-trans isomerase [Pseudomonadota bacterium]